MIIATVTAKIQLLEDVYRFELKTSEPVKWVAGQYIKYVLNHNNPDDRGISRWFTISAAPYENILVITTRFDFANGSTFKKALLNLKIGDTVETSQPVGDFILSDTRNIKNVYIAGGIGITPYYAMFKQLIYEHKNINCTLLYANRDEKFVFKKELDNFAERMDGGLNIQYIAAPHKITQSTIAESANDIKKTLYYISGPKPMVEYYKDMVAELGVESERIKLDDFPGYDHV